MTSRPATKTAAPFTDTPAHLQGPRYRADGKREKDGGNSDAQIEHNVNAVDARRIQTRLQPGLSDAHSVDQITKFAHTVPGEKAHAEQKKSQGREIELAYGADYGRPAEYLAAELAPEVGKSLCIHEEEKKDRRGCGRDHHQPPQEQPSGCAVEGKSRAPEPGVVGEVARCGHAQPRVGEAERRQRRNTVHAPDQRVPERGPFESEAHAAPRRAGQPIAPYPVDSHLDEESKSPVVERLQEPDRCSGPLPG